MNTTLAALYRYWPGQFGLTYQQLISDPFCHFLLAAGGHWGAEKQLHLDSCVGEVVQGHKFCLSEDMYYWTKI